MSADFATKRDSTSPKSGSVKASSARVLVELSDVSVVSPRNPRQVLIEGVDWVLRSGEIWIVTGSAGLEPSALLLSAAGLLPVGKGRCRILGRDPSSVSRQELDPLRRQVGFVLPPAGRLFGELTVEENVGLALRYHTNQSQAQVADRVRSLLDLVGVGQARNRPPAQLGRSEQVRVALARALAADPVLLFVDIALAGFLEPEIEAWVELLTGLAQERDANPARIEALVVGGEALRHWRRTPVRVGRVEEGGFRAGGPLHQIAAPADPGLSEALAVAAMNDKPQRRCRI